MSSTPEFDKWLWSTAARDMIDSMLTEKEKQDILMIFLYTRRKEGATEDEMHSLLAWASYTRAMSGMLDGLLNGDMLVDVKDGVPSFRLSPKGEENAIELARQMGLPVDRFPPATESEDKNG